jgi:hypothetical protein
MLRKLLVFAAVVAAELCFGLIFVLVFVNSTEVACALKPDETYTCRLQTLLLGRVRTFDRLVEGVVDVVVEDDCSDGCSYRAEFVTADGRQVPVSEVWTDRGPVERQAADLSQQMERRANPVLYTADPPWWVLWLVGGLTVMGLLLSPLVLLSNRR